MSEFELHPQAVTDVEEIWDYIAQDNLAAADRLVDEIFAAFAGLAAMPEKGYIRKDLTNKPVRFWLVRHYLIVYQPRSTPLRILAVIHGARNVLVLGCKSSRYLKSPFPKDHTIVRLARKWFVRRVFRAATVRERSSDCQAYDLS